MGNLFNERSESMLILKAHVKHVKSLRKELEKVDWQKFLDSIAQDVVDVMRDYPFLDAFNLTPSVMKMGCFTVVHLKAVGKSYKPGQEYEALGFARRSKKDKDNPKLAEQIAKGRAMKALEMKLRGHVINKKYMG